MNDPLVGTVLQDRYRVVRLLGEGGMGAVYEAENVKIGRRVAVKVLHRQYARDAGVVARFHREAKAATAIGHPHIIEVLDLGELPDGGTFMVLELLSGHDWSDELRGGGQPLPRVASILVQVCDALEAAHEKGIVHRDLKPDNIFLIERHGRDDFVKVLDFGISKMQPSPEEQKQITGTHMILGTASYMSPEQVRSTKSVDHRSDLYTVGVILFRALTGAFPVDADSLPILLMNICQAPRPSLAQHRPDLPREVVELCDRLLSIDPAVRPSSAREIADVLRPWAGESAARSAPAPATGPLRSAKTAALVDESLPAESVAPSETQVSRESPRKPPILLGVAALVVVAAAVAALTFAAPWDDGAPEEPAETTRAAREPEAPADSGATTGPEAASPPAELRCPDGSVLVPAGAVRVGEETHEVAAVCMGRTEVTVREFRGCVERGDCPEPASGVNTEGLRDHELGFWNSLCNYGRAERADHPMNCVGFFDAQSYCSASGGRLPSRDEWQLAAGAGPYPWGAAPPDATRANVCGRECVALAAANRQGEWPTTFDSDDGFGGTAPVGRFALGATPHGILDLGGNVWEWTSTAMRDGDVLRVNLGGGFATTEPVNLRVDAVNVLPPTSRDATVGFRCAYVAQ